MTIIRQCCRQDVAEVVEGDHGDLKGRYLLRVSKDPMGCDSTDVDILDIIAWVRENKPELLN